MTAPREVDGIPNTEGKMYPLDDKGRPIPPWGALKMCPYCGKILDDGRGDLSRQQGEFFCSPEHEVAEKGLREKLTTEWGQNIAEMALIFHEWNPRQRIHYEPYMSWPTCVGTAKRLESRGVVVLAAHAEAEAERERLTLALSAILVCRNGSSEMTMALKSARNILAAPRVASP